MTTDNRVILPGKTLGILGGGQLGRMTAMAARELGYRIRVLDPDLQCAARYLVEEHVHAGFSDIDRAVDLAKRVDVMTLEIEKIDTRVLDAVGAIVPMHPNARTLAIIGDRAEQKSFYRSHGLPVGAFEIIDSAPALKQALDKLGGRAFVKVAHGGYDGRGQFETNTQEDADAAFAALGSQKCVAEKAIGIDSEVSVMVARNARGEVAVYPPAQNHHEERILAWSVLPGSLPIGLVKRAEELARQVAEKLQIVGLCCVEMFVIGNDLLINEVAPRPHNSYHASVIGCLTSQFEQHVRSVCNLPLGSTEVVRPAAICNLLGDLWDNQQAPAFDRALALPGVRVHLYGKEQARPGRKMGHLSASAHTSEAAVEMVKRAQALLVPVSDSPGRAT